MASNLGIEKGTQLKHVQTEDKSKPIIENVTLKTVDRDGFLKEVETHDSLKKAETSKDCSVPKIEPGATVHHVDRVLQMQAVKLAAVARQLASGKDIDLVEVHTVDKSAPQIPKDASVKQVDRTGLLTELEKGAELKKVETKDSSVPNVEGAKVEVTDRVLQMQAIKLAAVVREILLGKVDLEHTDTADKTGPVIPEDYELKSFDRKSLLEELEKGAELKKVETKEPQLNLEGVKVETNDRALMLQALRLAAVARELNYGENLTLIPTKTVDKTVPVIAPGTRVRSNSKEQRVSLCKEVVEPPELKKTETCDCSAPKVEGLTIQQIDRIVQLQALKLAAVARELGFQGGVASLNPTVTADKSVPVIDPEAKVKMVDRKELVAGVTNPPELKHAEAVHDASKPMIEKDTHIKPNPHGDLVNEIKKK